jgi:hypothetical protein
LPDAPPSYQQGPRPTAPAEGVRHSIQIPHPSEHAQRLAEREGSTDRKGTCAEAEDAPRCAGSASTLAGSAVHHSTRRHAAAGIEHAIQVSLDNVKLALVQGVDEEPRWLNKVRSRPDWDQGAVDRDHDTLRGRASGRPCHALKHIPCG